MGVLEIGYCIFGIDKRGVVEEVCGEVGCEELW